MNMIVEIDDEDNIHVAKTLMTSGGPYSSDVICLTIQHVLLGTVLLPRPHSINAEKQITLTFRRLSSMSKHFQSQQQRRS